MADGALIDLYDAAKQGKWSHLVGIFNDAPRLTARAARYTKSTSGWTFLHQAAYFNQEVAVRVLIGGGANAARRANSGETPAEVAARRGHKELSRLLRHAAATGHDLWEPSDDLSVLPSSSAWPEADKRRAQSAMKVGYGGAAISVSEGTVFYADSFGRVLVGWHGTYSPPCGMDGEPMV